MNTQTIDHGQENAKGWLSSIEEMLETMQAARNAYNTEDAERTIHESVLSVQVRSGWYSPGGDGRSQCASEYEILLSTGGPALRIIGRLDEYMQPTSAEMQHQDWGTPWTRFPAPEATLRSFASCFYFGEG